MRHAQCYWLLTGAAGSAAGAVGVLVDHVYPGTDTGAALSGFRLKIREIAVLSSLSVLVVAPSAGQFTSGVNLVEVYASVLDARGEPVGGSVSKTSIPAPPCMSSAPA